MGWGKLVSAGAAAVVGTAGVTTAVVTNNVPGFVKKAVRNVNTEVDNCFGGGCDPTRPEVQAVAQKRIDQASALVGQVKGELASKDWKKYEEIYSDPMSYQSMRTLWGEFARLSDEHLLDGALSRNFGHVTNKHQHIADLKQQGVLALGHEISHADYVDATRYAALSVAAENPAPIMHYFKRLAAKSYKEMRDSLEQAMQESSDKSQVQLQAVMDQFSEEYLITVLVAYVSTGAIPQLSFDASLPSVKVGVLTYSRAERSPLGEVKTPNTHQPYILIKLPTINVRTDNTNGASDRQPVVEQPVVEQPVVEQPVVKQPVVKQPVERPQQTQHSSACVPVDSRSGWQRFSLPGTFTKVASISGGWSVDARSYAPVGASGHNGRDAEGLAPHNQYKYDQGFPFGALIVDIPTDGYGYTWVSQPQQLSKPITETTIRINDADNALGDNEGSLQVCFSN
jgi:hypothetical protein